MRFRIGMVMGFAAGYYFGAKAGRERYLQLNSALRKIRRSQVVDLATDYVSDHLPGSSHHHTNGNGDIPAPISASGF